MNSISKTSLLTAAMRAIESQRPLEQGRLVDDPLASRLAGEEGFELRRRGIEASGDQPAIAIRTHFIDQAILKAVADGYHQVVLFAAGMDTRAYRMPLHRNVIIFEVDRKEVFEYKENLLLTESPVCQKKVIATDILQNHWPQKLVNESFNIKEKSIYIIEGLMMYLEESQAHSFMHCLSQFAKKDDIIIMDIFNKFLLKSPHMQMQLDFLKSIGAPWLFGVDDVSEFFSNYDWTAKATQPGQYNPNRWPFPVAPDFVKEVPRSYYVVAKKNK